MKKLFPLAAIFFAVWIIQAQGITNWGDVNGIISAHLTNVITIVSFGQSNAAQFFRVAQLP